MSGQIKGADLNGQIMARTRPGLGQHNLSAATVALLDWAIDIHTYRAHKYHDILMFVQTKILNILAVTSKGLIALIVH